MDTDISFHEQLPFSNFNVRQWKISFKAVLIVGISEKQLGQSLLVRAFVQRLHNPPLDLEWWSYVSSVIFFSKK
ncbi:hypothetical protein D3C87_1570660 [compost metagenome]